ncbi:hypothetical protein Ancab_022649 [Ancistrocladus abbreviatus]
MLYGRRATTGNVSNNGAEKVVALAVCNDKASRFALKWALDNNVVSSGQTLTLIYIHRNRSAGNTSSTPMNRLDQSIMDIFLPFRCFCIRKRVHGEMVVLQNTDIAKGLIGYVSNYVIDTLIMGASSKKGIGRLFKTDVPTSVMKGAPDFCSVYIVSRGKVSSKRHATSSPPPISPAEREMFALQNLVEEADSALPPTLHTTDKLYDEVSVQEDCASLASSEDEGANDARFFTIHDEMGFETSSKATQNAYVSSFSEPSLVALDPSIVHNLQYSVSRASPSHGRSVSSEINMGDEHYEMKLVTGELEQAKDMHHAACKTTNVARQKEKGQNSRLWEPGHQNEAWPAIRAGKSQHKLQAIKASTEMHENSAENETMRAMEEVIARKVSDALAKIYTILKYIAFFHVIVLLMLIASLRIWT